MSDIRKVDHKNNFDFIRLVAASMVLFSHQYFLMGTQEPALFGKSGGAIAVLIFFSISGYLVTQSWWREPNLILFLWKRILRIWPGLLTVGVLSILILGPIVTSFTLGQYFQQTQVWNYLKNLILIKVVPLDLFSTNPSPYLNGSLWTIPFEMKWYYIWSVVCLLGALKKKWIVPIIWLSCVLYFFIKLEGGQENAHFFNLHFGIFFLSGAALAVVQPTLNRSRKFFLYLFAILISLVAAYFERYSICFLMLLPMIVIDVGTQSWPFLRRAGRWGDFSYGIYLYAWPVQQFGVWLFGKEPGYGKLVVFSFVVTVLLAALSWHFVEKRALKYKNAPKNWKFLQRFSTSRGAGE